MLSNQQAQKYIEKPKISMAHNGRQIALTRLLPKCYLNHTSADQDNEERYNSGYRDSYVYHGRSEITPLTIYVPGK
jgi:hypothetical protein